MKFQSLNGDWEFRQPGTDDWLPAQVPGGVHTDLLAAGLIPDPFVGDNELRVQWVAEADWEYRKVFRVGPEMAGQPHIYLACDGLDTLAEVRLNGRLVGVAANMFHPHRWEVGGLLLPGDNELRVLFSSAVGFAAACQRTRPLPSVLDALPGSPHIRKAPCHFGWDWGPRLPTTGIWREIRLEVCGPARLEDVHIRQRHSEDGVSVSIVLEARAWEATGLSASVVITDPDGKVLTGSTRLSGRRGEVELAIPNPKLWWPNGLGGQPLYRVEVVLGDENDELDRWSGQVGLRTLTLRQEEDEWGRSFTFVVNGVPLFAKGSNWIPADSFPTRITRQHLEKLVGGAAASNQNMLRVWGGGYYESEAFYDLCDQYGILVWQDCMFACSVYPLDEAPFLEKVQREVIYNVRRLRHRACLALWCGNNEMDTGWAEWGWDRPENAGLKQAYRDFFYQTLPAWINAEDPDHPYHPSSPSTPGLFEAPNSDAGGDNHLWEVWHANRPFRYYRSRYPRFASEFGFQSLPALATIASYAEKEDWNLTSYVMEHHQRNRAGNAKIISQMADNFRMPGGFEALVYLSQVQQAEAMRIGVEHWRRNRQRCSGALYWQLNDCWPVASWSSLDYYGRWKALQYIARRFFAPALFSVAEDGLKMELHLTNDLVEAWQGEVRWQVETVDGERLESGRLPVNASPLADALLARLDFTGKITITDSRRCVFFAGLYQAEACLGWKAVPFVPDKHLELQDPHLEVNVTQTGSLMKITVLANYLARHIALELQGADVIFSDNYFDLPAGQPYTVSCPLPEGWCQDDARQALRIRSLWDTYGEP